MPKKSRLPSNEEEPPSDWWHKTSYRQGKIRRIKLNIKKKRHRQFKIVGGNNVSTEDKSKACAGYLEDKN